MTIKALYPTIRPSLDLNFARTRALDPRITYTRLSTGTFVDSNGLIQSVASGVPRFDHDPATGESLGLLVEEARTNLVNGSQTFATTGGTQNNWVDANITRDGTLRTSPDGTANALRVTASAANGTIISSAAIGTSASRTFSIFLRRVTGTGNIQYTLDNGSTWTTQVITSSWVRYSFSATTANQQVGIQIVTSGDAIELWGIQMEAGSFPTSYIPTTTATVTRAADVASMTGTNFSSWYNTTTGTWLGSISAAAKGYRLLDATGPGGSDLSMSIRPITSGNYVMFARDNSGVSSVNYTGSQIKIGASYDASSIRGVANGTLANLVTTGNHSSSTTLRIGNDLSGSTPLNGTISRLAYYPVRLPDAQLQALTAT